MHLSTSAGVRRGLVPVALAVALRLDLTERSRVCTRCVRLQFDIKPLGTPTNQALSRICRLRFDTNLTNPVMCPWLRTRAEPPPAVVSFVTRLKHLNTFIRARRY